MNPLPPFRRRPNLHHRRGIGLALVVALFAGCGAGKDGPAKTGSGVHAARGEVSRGPRSVVLLTLDTTRADHLEPYGAPAGRTPALAELARGGVVFEHAWAVAPVTLPTHATLLTGLEPPAHGVRDNGIFELAEDVLTLPEILAGEGWRTGAFVSAAVLERRYGLAQGFEVYDDDLSGGGPREARSMLERPGTVTVDAARAWLDTLGEDERFFLWVHLFEPHAPYSPPEAFAARFRDDPYSGEVAALDAGIGRLLAHPRLAAAVGTVVVAVGDHGESLGEHGERTHGMLIYDAVLRVPWILRLPGGPTGLRVDAPVGQEDLVPTLLDLLGLASPAAAAGPGTSLLPLLEGSAPTAAGGGRAFYAESLVPFYAYGWAPLRALRRGGLKYIAAPAAELYDLEKDPGELANVLSERPAEAAPLAAELTARLAVFGETAEADAAVSAPVREADERLRALGYLAGGARRAAGAPRLDPKTVIDLHESLQRVGVELQQGRFEQAVGGLRTVLARDPGNLTALQDLSHALLGMGRIDDAAAALDRALSLAPADAALLLARADVEGRRGNDRRALELARAALEAEPHSQEARLETARFLARSGRSEEAAALLEQALAESANSPWVELRYAQLVELPRGDLPAAEARLRRATARDPHLAEAWKALAELLERSGRPAEAAAAYRAGLERQPRDAGLAAGLAALLAAGGDAAAGDALRRALELAPAPRPDLRLALGDWLAAAGRRDEARREWANLAAGRPEDPAAANVAAQALIRLGRAAEAESTWRRLTEAHPDFAPAHNNLASLAVSRRAWGQAEDRARRAVELDPALAAGWNNLGIALEEQQRGREAEAAYRQALAVEPGYWQAGYNLGLLLGKTGRPREAAAAFEAILRKLPRHPGALFELGRLEAGPLGDRAAARRHLEAALTAAPDHPRAAEIRKLLAQL